MCLWGCGAIYTYIMTSVTKPYDHTRPLVYVYNMIVSLKLDIIYTLSLNHRFPPIIEFEIIKQNNIQPPKEYNNILVKKNNQSKKQEINNKKRVPLLIHRPISIRFKYMIEYILHRYMYHTSYTCSRLNN